MNTAASVQSARMQAATARAPWTLWVGLIAIVSLEALLWVDVQARGGAVVPWDALPSGLLRPQTSLERIARWVAVNMTALSWVAYLLLADGLLTLLARRRGDPAISSIRARPNRFVVAWLTSIPVWCFFDWVNFYWMDAWRYHGLPAMFSQRAAGYFIAFAAISPGMFLAAQFYQALGLKRWVAPHDQPRAARAWAVVLPVWLILAIAATLVTHQHLPEPQGSVAHQVAASIPAPVLLAPPAIVAVISGSVWATSAVIGACFLFWSLAVAHPVGNLGLWVGLIFLLDPVSALLKQPSLLRDWQHGRYGRTLALFAGGATCGFLWEFWNYWAIAKWTYHLPFLGELERYRYFEMPWLGFLGFLPFAAECWVMLNVIIGLFARLGAPMVEPLPNDDAVF